MRDTEGAMRIADMTNEQIDSGIAQLQRWGIDDSSYLDDLLTERSKRIAEAQADARREEHEGDDLTIRKFNGNQMYFIEDALECIEEGDDETAEDVKYAVVKKTMATMTVRVWQAVWARIDETDFAESAANSMQCRTDAQVDFAYESGRRAAQALENKIGNAIDAHMKRALR